MPTTCPSPTKKVLKTLENSIERIILENQKHKDSKQSEEKTK